MTDCPCWGDHDWYYGTCNRCDCCFLCVDCDQRRPAPNLIHQCTHDPKER